MALDDATAFNFLMDAYHAAFAALDYDRAYHLLASAMHLGEANSNESWLVTVSKDAETAHKKIDAAAPEYKHSSQSAAKRGTAPIFHTLSLSAATNATIQARKHKSL